MRSFFDPPTHFQSKPEIIGFSANIGYFLNQAHVIKLTEFKNEIPFLYPLGQPTTSSGARGLRNFRQVNTSSEAQKLPHHKKNR